MTPARLEEIRRQLGVGTLWDSATVRELLDYIGELQRGAAVVVPGSNMPTMEFLSLKFATDGERNAAIFGWQEGRNDLRESIQSTPTDRARGEAK